jgi:cation diffusion facilitator CzcD-associated flavoprotein CzcO
MNSTQNSERFETVIVGGDQAGLAADYNLTKRGHSCVILDANEMADYPGLMWNSVCKERRCHLSRGR